MDSVLHRHGEENREFLVTRKSQHSVTVEYACLVPFPLETAMIHLNDQGFFIAEIDEQGNLYSSLEEAIEKTCEKICETVDQRLAARKNLDDFFEDPL